MARAFSVRVSSVYIRRDASYRPQAQGKSSSREDTWKLFGYAVEYRNLLALECTSLGLDKFSSLIAACQAILEKLVQLGRVPEKRIKLGARAANLDV